MTLVATFIGSPKAQAATPALARAVEAVVQGRMDWLADGIAFDLALPGSMSPSEAEATLRPLVAGLSVDLAIQPAANRRKRLLLADMDSTVIDQECIDELADEVGLKDRVAAITARSMNGEIAFEPALRERVALLEGLDEGVVQRIIDNRISLAAGGGVLVRTMRANGAWTALVSGGFTAFTGPIAAQLGFDENRANTLLAANGKLIGKVAEPILGREAKATALLDISAKRDLTPADAIVVGDGANDLDMIKLAGAGVALHAKPAVAAQASIRIDHGDLTALLYLQGYRQAEFVQ